MFKRIVRVLILMAACLVGGAGFAVMQSGLPAITITSPPSQDFEFENILQQIDYAIHDGAHPNQPGPINIDFRRNGNRWVMAIQPDTSRGALGYTVTVLLDPALSDDNAIAYEAEFLAELSQSRGDASVTMDMARAGDGFSRIVITR